MIVDPNNNWSNKEKFLLINLLDLFGILYEFILVKYFKFTFLPYSFDVEMINSNILFQFRKYPTLLR